MPPIRVSNSDVEMFDMATLILRASSVRERLTGLLRQNSSKVRTRLYVQLHPQQSPSDLLSVLPVVYEKAAANCPQLDVRLLLGNTKPNLTQFFDDDISEEEVNKFDCPIQPKKYDYVVLGGTFDRFHYGHKLLLSTAILLANKYIVCGVTDKEMNHSKSKFIT
jgi:cytidyltransferase-like protein